MSELKKALLIRMLITCLCTSLVGILLLALDGNLIVKILSIVFGVLLICYGIFNASEAKNNTTLLALSILEILCGVLLIFHLHMIVSILSGVFLIALPLASIILNNKYWQDELKKQLPSLIFGVLLIFFGVGSLFDLILNILGYISIGFSIVYFILGSISLSKHK